MPRTAYFVFTDFDQFIDLADIDNKRLSISKMKKGELRSNKKTIQRYNSISLHTLEDLPDEYEERIELLIRAIGGEERLKTLVLKYGARINAIVLGMPTRTEDSIEDGYISKEMMGKLARLGLDLQFYHT